ncbi:membrane protein [Chania multitudinisentens RB-25]|uniref:Membrane protein n=1 Tax=Chania multitudinisentens RB-25 TaxID=1441930 RepID=W0LHN0_9GAMM|nr:inner membrane protein YbjM [Chania multitudinisentens]AHG21909.1 membrane protein [Chania multitudinisentens RB-25]
MARYRCWMGIFSCFLLFNLVFLGQKSEFFGGSGGEHHGEIGLLLFIIPGFIASALSSKKRILYPLLGALYAVPFCLFIHHFLWLMPGDSFWQELAYVISAVFWCALGAMLCLFIRVVMHALQQLYQSERL